MKKNELLKCGDRIVRVLEVRDEETLIVDCLHKSMPKWVRQAELEEYAVCTEQELASAAGKIICDYDSLDRKSRCFAHEHFSMIAGVLPFVGDEKQRCSMIARIAAERGVSKQTIKRCLWLYLAYQDIAVLAPKQKRQDRTLTQDEKNMRWHSISSSTRGIRTA